MHDLMPLFSHRHPLKVLVALEMYVHMYIHVYVHQHGTSIAVYQATKQDTYIHGLASSNDLH